MSDRPRVVVVGAGAFGGWTALSLIRRGATVTLIDAWGSGNVRASSGGDTRLIRATYGPREIYSAMALRALELWREFDAAGAGAPILHVTGLLWMFTGDDSFGRTSADVLSRCGGRLDAVSVADAAKQYPQINFDDVTSVFLEADAGFLLARRGCEAVVERFQAAGGLYRVAAALPVRAEGKPIRRITLQDGSALEADAFVFACGPWLPELFPELLKDRFSVTRQEVYYFAPPAGSDRFGVEKMPAWIDFGSRQIYGVPAHGASGFKVADDLSGPPFDPSSLARQPTPAGVTSARQFLARRFPALGNAPLVGAEVCQYESTPDDHFIIDRHPGAVDVWIAGGGSGHGYKMGPAIGEMVASLVLDGAAIEPQFSLARFEAPPERWPQKWGPE